jgi:hypothetical protein
MNSSQQAKLFLAGVRPTSPVSPISQTNTGVGKTVSPEDRLKGLFLMAPATQTTGATPAADPITSAFWPMSRKEVHKQSYAPVAPDPLSPEELDLDEDEDDE